ncbi:hypothetical protein [Propionivibrio sp.]|uniref:hypothetical protein n=1 Tax=Propionivibrio sp. TaxID=2212460 RepID=UPI003BF35293
MADHPRFVVKGINLKLETHDLAAYSVRHQNANMGEIYRQIDSIASGAVDGDSGIRSHRPLQGFSGGRILSG